MDYYSAIKRNKFESVVMRWMNLEPLIQSESKREKQVLCINIYIYIYIYIYIHMEARKMVLMNLRERTCRHSRGR